MTKLRLPFERTIKARAHTFSQKYPYKWCSNIEVTNNCPNSSCIYCSRFLRHIPDNKRYNLSLEKIEEALAAYEGFPERIGIIGGEPLIHPQFPELCELLLHYNQKEKYCLFTSINPETSKYGNLIKSTFGHVAYNPHSTNQLVICKHQPLTLSAKDMVLNKDLRNELYEQCYFRLKWAGTVNPLGAFHCEIAASIGYLIGQKGWTVKKGWWLNDWHQQEELCELCGGAVPQERQLLCSEKEKMSPSFLQLLEDNDCIVGDVELIKQPYTIEYLESYAKESPGAYRGDLGLRRPSTIKIKWSKYRKT